MDRNIEQSYSATLDYANEKLGEQDQDIIEISVDPAWTNTRSKDPGSCPRCIHYEQELVTLRGMEVVWRLKHSEELRLEWEKLHTFQAVQMEHNERLKAELEESKVACVQYAKTAEVNAALAQKLQEEIKMVRTENENLLTTIQETFHNYSKTKLNVNVCNTADTPHKNEKTKIVVQYPKKPVMCKVNNVKKDNKAVKCKQEIEDEDSDTNMSGSEDDDENNTHVNGYLETKTTALKPEEALSEKICMWTEPGQHPCHEMFQTMREMRNHVKNEHVLEDSVYCLWKNCAMKGHMFKQKRSMVGHIVMHTSEHLFKCKSAGCGKSFAYRSQLEKHSRTHADCKQNFPRQENVAKNVVRDNQVVHQRKDQMYLCKDPACDGVFLHKDALTRHEQSVHAPVKTYSKKLPSHNHKQVVRESYQCQISSCGKKFLDYKEFLNHRVKHVCQRPQRCTVPDCNRLFVNKYKLDRHSAMHASDEPLPCPKCSKVFPTRYKLQYHMKIVHMVTYQLT